MEKEWHQLKYVLYDCRTNKYFKNGDFTADNKSEASMLDKDKAERIKKLFNGIMMSKPIKIEIV